MPDFVTATVNLRANTTNFQAQTEQAFGGLRRQLRETKASFQALAVGAGLFAGAATLVGKSVIDAAVQMDSMKRGLEAVSGSAAAAEAQMVDLREVAKLPGLGLPEAIEGSTRLQAVGINAEQANRALMAFGNALARVGKGREELSGVVLALTQIAGKGKVSAEEINQIAERVPEVRKVMMEAFGTASTEAIQEMNITTEQFIETLTEGFEKLPKVTGGAQNSIENFNDAIFEARVALGDALLPAFTNILSKLSDLVNKFNNLSATTKSTIAWSGALAGGLAGITAAVAGLGLALPSIIAGVKALGMALTFLAANPVAALGIALVGFIEIMRRLNQSMDASKYATRELGKALSELSQQEISREISKIEREISKLETSLAKTGPAKAGLLAGIQAALMGTMPGLDIAGFEDIGKLKELRKVLTGLKAEQKLPQFGPTAIGSTTKFDFSAIKNIEERIRKERATTAEMQAGLIKDEQERELALLKVRHDAEKTELDARLALLKGANENELQLIKILNDQKAALDAEYNNERQKIIGEYADKEKEVIEKREKEEMDFRAKISAYNKKWAEDKAKVEEAAAKKQEKRLKAEMDLRAKIAAWNEKWAEDKAKVDEAAAKKQEKRLKAEMDLRAKIAAWNEKLTEQQQKIASKAYQTRWRDFSIFNKDVIAAQDEQVASFIRGLEEAEKGAKEWQKDLEIISRDSQEEFDLLASAIGSKFSEIFLSIADDGKEAMSNLEFATQGFAKAFSGDYLGLINTVTTYFGQVFDVIRGIDREFAKAIESWEDTISDSVADVISRGILDGLSTVDIEKGIREFLGKAVIARAVTVLVQDLPQLQEAITEWATAIEESLGEFSEAGRQISRAEQARISKAAQQIGVSTKEIAGVIQPLAQDVGIVERPAGLGRLKRLGVEPIGRGREEGEERATKGQAGSAIQISAITGPTRDLLVDLLMPLRNLNILPSLMEAMTRAIYEMRDVFLGKKVAPSAMPVFATAGAGGGDNIVIESVNIQVDKAADAGDLDELNRNLSRAVRTEKRLLGRRR